VHVPAPENVTVEPERLQTPPLLASIEKATARPELADAETSYAAPPTVADVGAVEVKLIVWTLFERTEIANDCCTCGAAACVPSPA
jgi:hypothetical protein